LKKEDNEFSNKLLASQLHVIQFGSFAEPATAKSNGKLGFMVLPGNTEQGELSQNIIQRNLSTVGYQVVEINK
jgi:hypothetical protein